MPGRRLLVVAYFYPPDPSVGSHRWDAFARHLRALGHEVTVLTTSAFGTLPDDGAHVVRTGDVQASDALRRVLRRPALGDAAAPAHVVGTPPKYLTHGLVPDAHLATWLPYAVPAARRLIRERGIDCVITNSPTDSTHLLGLLLGRDRPAWLMDLEDGWRFEPLRGAWPTAAQDRLDAALEARAVRAADGWVGLAKPIADDLARRFGVPAAYVPTGWDPGLEAGVAGAEPPALEPGTVSLVHTGVLWYAERRDPRPLLAALERVAGEGDEADRRLRLVLAGPMTAEDQALLGALSPAAAERVRHLGRLSRAEAVALQRRADALLLIASGPHTSTVTGKVFEYLAAEPPILALAAGNEAARVVAETRRGRVIAPDDVDGIAAALHSLARGERLVHEPPRDLGTYVLPGPAQAFAVAVEDAIGRRARRRQGAGASA